VLQARSPSAARVVIRFTGFLGVRLDRSRDGPRPIGESDGT
jgi:hypothetical protein